MSESPKAPTERELEILKVLWELGEGSVRQVHERLAPDRGIVQSTVQAFLRTMEAKGLVSHRVDGRSFLYRASQDRTETERGLVGGLLDRAFDGAIDQLVARALDVRQPPARALQELRRLLDRAERKERGEAP
jgi:predicted transcriptional regulator